MVSLDYQAKREHLLQVVADDEAPYFWAVGKVSLDKKMLWWENWMVEKIVGGDYVWLCMIVYDFIWLCTTMYDYVWLYMTLYDYV